MNKGKIFDNNWLYYSDEYEKINLIPIIRELLVYYINKSLKIKLIIYI